MRLQEGESITLFNGQGGEFSGQIEHFSKKESSCSVGLFVEVNRELECHIHVIQSACRSEKIDSVLQKGTELGAASFHIVRSERSTLKLDERKRSQRLARWQKIIIEAAEQSGRTALPSVSWHNAIGDINSSGPAFALHPEAGDTLTSIRQELREARNLYLAVGPEGGWSERDLTNLKACGFRALSFGERIMRTETAAPAMLAAIQAIRAISEK